MSNRADVSAILADIDDTISRVRDLSSSPARAAALQCLADARSHLARHQPGAVWGIAEYAAEGRLLPPIGTDRQYPIRVGDRLSLTIHQPPSVPPSATDNQRARAEISRSFRRTHEILKGIK